MYIVLQCRHIPLCPSGVVVDNHAVSPKLALMSSSLDSIALLPLYGKHDNASYK